MRITHQEGSSLVKGLYLTLGLLLFVGSAGYILTLLDPVPPHRVESVPKPAVGTAKPVNKPSPDSGKSTDATGRLATPKVIPVPARLLPPRHTEPPPHPQDHPAEGLGTNDEDSTADLSTFIPQGQAPSIEEVIEYLHQAGIHSGIGAFSPPGTSPPLVGLAVPEDFELPEGFIRHYQATDDGQRIEPILMFSPDYLFFDNQGLLVQIPDHRVVPPELAPLGLPLREIEIPPPLESGAPSR